MNAPPSRPVTMGAPEPLGLTLDDAGANVAVFSAHATAVELCLFAPSGEETARIALPGRSGDVWHGHVAGLRAGQHYGLRVHGPHAPEAGHRFNPAKLLLDPYAHVLTGPVRWSPLLVGADADRPALADARDSAAAMVRCVAAPPPPPVDPAERPATPWDRTVIYEAHAKGLTRLWPGLDPARAGTVEALAEPAVIDHLRALGVTAVELLPLHACTDERRLAAQGLSNYWGYNSVSFFAPEPRLLGPGGIEGLIGAVRRLHEAGLEVILDVVYNHSGESDHGGPTVSFRGLDNLSYYRRDPEGSGGYVNDTGCGNTLDLSHPFVLRMVMDSLRFWVERIGVDGFRFDLAPALTRGAEGFAPGSAFLHAVAQDPVLRGVKLIAEPWDVGPGGYRLGAFPPPWAEWNDRFRDAARGFWRSEAGAAAALGDGMLGSARIFDHGGRRPWASVNFVACHDGFTLADLTRYAAPHNHANGENNRDGHRHNLSENFGVEGPTDDPGVGARRARRMRNLAATALLAQGAPMLRAGDEIGQSQRGNNNAYCQDNEISWIDWSAADAAMLAFCRRAVALRADVPALRQPLFLHGEPRGVDGARNVEWTTLAGGAVNWDAVEDTGLALTLRPAGKGARDDVWALIAFNPGDGGRPVAPPAAPGRRWRRALDTAAADGAPGPGAAMRVAAESLSVFLAERTPPGADP